MMQTSDRDESCGVIGCRYTSNGSFCSLPCTKCQFVFPGMTCKEVNELKQQPKYRITSMEQLNAWNANPTEWKPIVMEWAYDHFFDCLATNKKREARDLYGALVKFTILAEKMQEQEAIVRTNENLEYFSGYASNWRDRWQEFKRCLEIKS